MALYRQIQTSFWEDDKVVEEFNPEDRYFMLYLMTNPHTNLLGCYSITIRQIEFETGYNKDTILKLLNRFEEILKVIEYDETTKEIFLKNWHKYNWTKSPKMLNGLKNDLQRVKSTKLQQSLDRVCIGYGYGIDRVSLALVIEQEKELVIEKEETKKEKIKNFCKEKKINIDIDKFFEYYEACNWKDTNDNPINWKQKAIKWSINNSDKGTTENERYNPYL